MNPKSVIACDIGGTKTLTALIDIEGKILFKERHPTPKQSAEQIVELVSARISKLPGSQGIDKRSILGVGIGVAGTVDMENGLVVSSPHLPFKDTPLKLMIGDSLKLPVLIDNDATLAALGEQKFGVAKGIHNMVMMTIGTGIGGGIIIKGEIYRGTTGGAGEIGHMVIDVNGPEDDCGARGCLEALASGDAIGEMAGGISGEQVAQSAGKGDQNALRVLKRAGKSLGTGLANLVNIFDPEMIILGGGVMIDDKIIIEEAKRVVAETALKPNRDTVRIVISELGEDAGLLGAAALVIEKVNGEQ